MWLLEFLGTARVLEDKQVVHLSRSTALLLLAFLATQTKPLRRAEITAHIFPNVTDQKRANSLLRTTLDALKNCLPDVNGQAPILKNGDTLLLNREVFQCDLWTFEENLAASYNAPDTETCLTLLKDAVLLYGRFLPIEEELDWLTDLRTHLETEFLDALSRLISLLSLLERWKEALRYVTLHIEYTPYHPKLLLQREQLRQRVLGGKSAEMESPLVWDEAIKSQRKRQKQFQTLMTTLQERGERPELFASEKRVLEAAVHCCLETFPQAPFQLAQWIAVLPSPLFREDVLALFDLSEQECSDCLAFLSELRLVTLKSDALSMSSSIKHILRKTLSSEAISLLEKKHARYFSLHAEAWINRFPLPTEERNRWSENNLPHLCQALDWTIDHLPEEVERLYPLLALVEDFPATHPMHLQLYRFTDRIFPQLDTLPLSHQLRLSIYIAYQMCRFQYPSRIQEPVERALELLTKMQGAEADPQWAGSLITLGNALHHSGGRARASERVLRAALSLCEQGERWEDLSRAYFELSECLWGKGRLPEVRDCLEQSLFFLKKAGVGKKATGVPLMNLGALALSIGEIDYAEACLNDALTYLEENTHLVALADTTAYLGAVATKRGNFGLANSLLTKSKERCDTIGQPRNGMRAVLFLGDNARARHQYEQAEAYYQEALCFWREHDLLGWVVISLSRLAELSLERGQEEQAETYAEELLTRCRGTTGLASRACAFYVKGILSFKCGEKPEAELFVKKAEALRSFLGMPMDFLRQQVAQAQTGEH